MLPFLPFHTLAAGRGDGLRPELLALFERHARPAAALSARIERETPAAAGNAPTNADSLEASSTSDAHHGDVGG